MDRVTATTKAKNVPQWWRFLLITPAYCHHPESDAVWKKGKFQHPFPF